MNGQNHLRIRGTLREHTQRYIHLHAIREEQRLAGRGVLLSGWLGAALALFETHQSNPLRARRVWWRRRGVAKKPPIAQSDQ
jgi:hypothetical protein